MKILVIEDESSISHFVRSSLVEQGHEVDIAEDGAEGLRQGLQKRHALIILDLTMPALDGVGVLRELRRQGLRTPVIVLTARASLEDRVAGLNEGADDYLTKPFYIEELIARVNAIARRLGADTPAVLSACSVTLHRARREARVGERKVPLTAREFSLLEYLCRSPGTIYTRTQILERVWEYHFDPKTNIIEVYIQRLRTKLAEVGAPNVIETIRGVGYRVRREPPSDDSACL